MKKLLTIACTVALAATMVVSVSAEEGDTDQSPLPGGTFPNPEDIEYNDVNLNTGEGENSTNIPVFGYVGEDADLTDPNPGDPTVPPVPEPTGTDMEISVPVKLLWAAFASEGGKITSPEYKIENKSAFAVDVTLTSFTNTTTNPNTALDNLIRIELTDLNPSATNVVGMTTPISAGTLTAVDTEGSTKEFGIGGHFSGNFGTVYQPTYRMVLTFSIH